MRLPWQPRVPVDAPDWDTPIDEAPLLAVDVETTGLDPDHDRVVSIGWVPIDAGAISLSGARYFVITGGPVGESATVHGLTDDTVATGVSIEQAHSEFTYALRGRVMLAHYADIERGFLANMHRRLTSERIAYPAVDTFAIERRHMERLSKYPRGEDLRLARVRARYGLPAYGNHNALTDALACAELFLAQTSTLKVTKLKDLRY